MILPCPAELLLFVGVFLRQSLSKKFFLKVNVLSAYKYVHLVGAWCPWRSEESSISPGTRVLDGCEPLCGFSESTPGALQEK